MSDRQFQELVHALIDERDLTLEALARDLALEPQQLEHFLEDRSAIPIAVLENLMASLQVHAPDFFARLYRIGEYRDADP
jgi:transcriptional regulator with XRE-family HTH domain